MHSFLVSKGGLKNLLYSLSYDKKFRKHNDVLLFFSKITRVCEICFPMLSVVWHYLTKFTFRLRRTNFKRNQIVLQDLENKFMS